MIIKATTIFCVIFGWSTLILAHEGHDHGNQADGIVAEWNFRPDYTLTGSAASKPEMAFPLARTKVLDVQRATLPVLMRGEEPTERVRNLLKLKDIPQHKFSVETWYNNHVNRPVGFAIIAGGPQESREDG